MKLIIIEGTDNTGKDTLISKILEKFPTSTVIHCGKPTSKKYSDKEQDTLFRTYARSIVRGVYDGSHTIIMNRSHIGEFVYGCLYRNRDKVEVEHMIDSIDNILTSRKDLQIYYIQLLCSSDKLLLGNEDGKSLSDGNISLITRERDDFEEIFHHSNLNKHLIYVNNGDNFRTKESIFNEVWKFINK